MEKKKLTSANGRLIADNQNTQTAGQSGFTGCKGSVDGCVSLK